MAKKDRLPPGSGQRTGSHRNAAPPPRAQPQSYYSDDQLDPPDYDSSAPQEMTFLQRLIVTSIIIAFAIFAKWVYMRMGK